MHKYFEEPEVSVFCLTSADILTSLSGGLDDDMNMNLGGED